MLMNDAEQTAVSVDENKKQEQSVLEPLPWEKIIRRRDIISALIATAIEILLHPSRAMRRPLRGTWNPALTGISFGALFFILLEVISFLVDLLIIFATKPSTINTLFGLASESNHIQLVYAVINNLISNLAHAMFSAGLNISIAFVVVFLSSYVLGLGISYGTIIRLLGYLQATYLLMLLVSLLVPFPTVAYIELIITSIYLYNMLISTPRRSNNRVIYAALIYAIVFTLLVLGNFLR